MLDHLHPPPKGRGFSALFDKEALAAELPTGSGEIENANRSVVQKRPKIAGAWWKPETAKYMLALRCVRINGAWERYCRSISPSFARAA